MQNTDQTVGVIKQKVDKVTIPRWFDAHLHLRDSEMLRTVLPCTLCQRATGAVVMPNPSGSGPAEPIDTVEKAIEYKKHIIATRNKYADMLANAGLEPISCDFEPVMTCYLTDHTKPEEVLRGFVEGHWKAVKMYLASKDGEGGTTGSAHGVRDVAGRWPVFEVMEKYGIPLLGHFEVTEKNVDEFDREVYSVERDLGPMLHDHPGMTVVFEHITDGRAADFIAGYDHPAGLYATVTPQHLMFNRNVMFWVPGKGRGLNPGKYCLPVPKAEEHRLKVRKYVTSGNRRFRAGTDSAPHDKSAKSKCVGCAGGMFPGRHSVEMYTQVFDEDNAWEHLGPFMSENFNHIYGMKVSEEMMTLERTPHLVDEYVGDVYVFMGGDILEWKLVS